MAQTISVKVTLKSAGGATGATMRIDRRNVPFNGQTTATMLLEDTLAEHTFTVWVFGSHLATGEFKVEQGPDALLPTTKMAVPFGRTDVATRGKFKHRA